ncbi:MAG: hypothetical protein CL917_14835 [Deltaproteobacteria bacterium]|nr:hypothetical protein [Deltaproteobacteria bacterium]
MKSSYSPRNKSVRSLRKRRGLWPLSFRGLSVIALSWLLIQGQAAAQDAPNSSSHEIHPESLGTVITVEIVYENGEWKQREDVQIIYCRPPLKTRNPVNASKIELLDDGGNTLSTAFIHDPRVTLPEDPRVPWARLDAVHIGLAIPLTGNPVELTFTEEFETRAAPSLTVDLTAVMNDFALNGAKHIPNCEQADPPFASIREQNLFILRYALERASDESDLPESEILRILNKYGPGGVKKMGLSRATEELIRQSLFQRR